MKEKKLEALDKQMKRVYWHRSRNDQVKAERIMKKTFSSPEFNFNIHLSENLLYAESGTT